MDGLESYLTVLIILFILGLVWLCLMAVQPSTNLIPNHPVQENSPQAHPLPEHSLELTPAQRAQLKEIHTDLYQLLEVFLELVHQHRLVYWAGGGTLLGAVRDGHIIDHDDDIDLCITSSTLARLIELQPEIRQRGYRLEKAGSIWKFQSSGSKIFLDLFEMIPSQILSDARIKWISAEPDNRKTWPHDYFYQDELEPWTDRPFGSSRRLIRIPAQPEPYLERQYGSDWRIPKITHFHHLV